MVMLSKYELECNSENEFFLKSKEPVLLCPVCGQPLKLRDHRYRVWKKEGGIKRWIAVPRYCCSNESCRRMHTALPDFLCKFKHYDSGVIEDVLDEVVTENDSGYEDHPCKETMQRWRSWLEKNRTYINGWMRSVCFRHLDMSEEFLKSTVSLLEELRERLSPGWLAVVLRFVYNSGGHLAT